MQMFFIINTHNRSYKFHIKFYNNTNIIFFKSVMKIILDRLFTVRKIAFHFFSFALTFMFALSQLPISVCLLSGVNVVL